MYFLLQAGIQEKDLTLALEPEAASVYCRTLETEANIVQRVGTEYMVLDCGGKLLGLYIVCTRIYSLVCYCFT